MPALKNLKTQCLPTFLGYPCSDVGQLAELDTLRGHGVETAPLAVLLVVLVVALEPRHLHRQRGGGRRREAGKGVKGKV